MKSLVPIENIARKIYSIRGMKVILDMDLSELYGVETRALKQAVRRNQKRFPYDFMFVLTKQEVGDLTSQIVISSWGGRRHPPMAFTEQGVAMTRPCSRLPPAFRAQSNNLICRFFLDIVRLL